jgi:uncharacterized protein YgbK (DUF1537 family)
MEAPHSTEKYVWYGDDFTGASDTLATVSQAGLRTILFTGIPTPEQFGRAGPLDAFGIAGAARSMRLPRMRAELAKISAFLATTGGRIFHYKCCSTFDSAPHVGSIGVAVQSLRTLARENPVYVVGGQPTLGRYCVFGQLYAVAQQGGPVYRIDRHPTMSHHPVTPMQEADLRLHLARQGLGDIALVDIRAHELPAGLDAAVGEYDAGRSGDAGPGIVLLDVSTDRQLGSIGTIIVERAQRAPLLVVGASSVAQALIDHWRLPRRAHDGVVAPARGPVFVLAGSLSPVTARQITGATDYIRVPLAPDRLITETSYRVDQAQQIARLLQAGRHVLAYTTPVGDAQESIDRAASSAAAAEGHPIRARDDLAAASGALLNLVLERVRLSRVGIAGGDTSSHAIQSLGAWGLEWLGQLDAGVPLLRTRSDEPAIEGLELMLKGGQMGGPDLFAQLIRPT